MTWLKHLFANYLITVPLHPFERSPVKNVRCINYALIPFWIWNSSLRNNVVCSFSALPRWRNSGNVNNEHRYLEVTISKVLCKTHSMLLIIIITCSILTQLFLLCKLKLRQQTYQAINTWTSKSFSFHTNHSHSININQLIESAMLLLLPRIFFALMMCLRFSRAR